jgi:FAD/FMN-containing dehydrogenase
MDDTTFCIDALSDFFYPHLLKTEDFSNHVTHCELVGRIIMRDALQKNLARFDDELKAQKPKGWEIIDKRSRTIITLVGEVTYSRRIYLDTYGNRRYLLDEVLGIAPRIRIEPNAFLWIVRTAANVSYEKTARAFKDRTGAFITRQSVKRCIDLAGDLLAERMGRPPDSPPISVPILFGEFDGFYVDLQSERKQPALPRRTYKAQFKKKSMEFKVWVAYAGKAGNKRIHPFHWTSDASPEEFFAECISRTQHSYETDDLDYLVSGADAAGWCKANDIDALLPEGSTVLPKLDVYHINQKLYRAFTSEEDRSLYLGLLYGKDFDEFFKCLQRRMEKEPCHERQEHRQQLYSYIASNLDWLKSPSLSSCIRGELIEKLKLVFCGRPCLGYLQKLLSKRRYKRFVCVLEKMLARCADELRDIYQGFYDEAKEAIAAIRRYTKVHLGTMEGTNAKVYAARLCVWGCSWSRRGALAMMRIRAAIFSGIALVAPGYDAHLSEKERKRIDAWRHRGYDIPKSAGKGYEPPQGLVFRSNSLTPELYGLVRG